MQLMKYKIVKETSSYDLSNKVEFWIDKGWKPQGGVSFSPNGGLILHETWAQAMVKA